MPIANQALAEPGAGAPVAPAAEAETTASVPFGDGALAKPGTAARGVANALAP